MLLDEQNITRQSVNTMLHEHQMQLGHILEVSSMDLLIQCAEGVLMEKAGADSPGIDV